MKPQKDELAWPSHFAVDSDVTVVDGLGPQDRASTASILALEATCELQRVEAVDDRGNHFSAALGLRDRAILIGSSASCRWRLEQDGVESEHLELVWEQGGLWLNARAPVLVAGRSVIGWEPLREHEVVLGSAKLTLNASSKDALPEVLAAEAPSTAPQAPGLDADLAERFALPPEDENDGSAARPPLLRRKLLGAPVSAWLVVSLALITAAYALTTADWLDRVTRPPRAVRVLPTEVTAGDVDAKPTTPTRAVERAEVRQAAELLAQRDLGAALAAYTELAEAAGPTSPYAIFAELLGRLCAPGTMGAGPCTAAP